MAMTQTVRELIRQQAGRMDDVPTVIGCLQAEIDIAFHDLQFLRFGPLGDDGGVRAGCVKRLEAVANQLEQMGRDRAEDKDEWSAALAFNASADLQLAAMHAPSITGIAGESVELDKGGGRYLRTVLANLDAAWRKLNRLAVSEASRIQAGAAEVRRTEVIRKTGL